MTGITINEFIDELYYNPEIEFVFDHKRYMVSGYVNNTGETYTLEAWNVSNNSEIFSISDENREFCVSEFERAEIFNGKTIYEAESEIEVLYG